MSYLSLISEESKYDFESNLILIIIVKICLRLYVSKNTCLKKIDEVRNLFLRVSIRLKVRLSKIFSNSNCFALKQMRNKGNKSAS